MGLLDVNGSPLTQSSSASGGVWSRMRGFFKRKRQPAHDDDDDDDDQDDILPSSKLPRIDVALIPKSVDMEQLEADAAASAQLSEEARRAADLQSSRNMGVRNPNLRIHVAAPADDGFAEDDEEWVN